MKKDFGKVFCFSEIDMETDQAPETKTWAHIKWMHLEISLLSSVILYKSMSRKRRIAPFVFVCTNETYIHQTHALSNSYLGINSTINHLYSKGERLIILQVIAPDGPICERIK
jgi:hypothetical protein